MARRKSTTANPDSPSAPELVRSPSQRPTQVSGTVASTASEFLSSWDQKRNRWLRKALDQWYGKHARRLPWRETQDPYRIWISEIMLQQTTVKAVIPYYERFLARFSTLQMLAAASESDVLQYWEGLGYYSRGRNLRLAAIEICENCHGQFPSDLSDIQKLPGIGRYTAGAISSFAFNKPAPIVEANTLRLYCRLLGYDQDPRSKAGQDLLWKFAEQIQPQREAGQLNQALMELGSVVCTPNDPACEHCPLQRHCAAFIAGKQAEIPLKKARVEVTQTVEATVAIRNGNRFLLRQRTASERWAGMWDFPRFPIDSVSPDEKITTAAFVRLQAQLLNGLNEMVTLPATHLELVTEIFHSVTRYRIRLLCLTAQLEGTSQQSELAPQFCWATFEELAALPMPVTGRQFAELLAKETSSPLFRKLQAH